MEKETRELINQLAEKLGTTAEYLWSVMIKQAPVYAATTILEIMLVCGMGYVLYKVHRKLSKKKEDGYSNCLYDEYELSAQIPMVLAALVWGVFFIAAFFSISNVVTAIINPEYWALMKILDKC